MRAKPRRWSKARGHMTGDMRAGANGSWVKGALRHWTAKFGGPQAHEWEPLALNGRATPSVREGLDGRNQPEATA